MPSMKSTQYTVQSAKKWSMRDSILADIHAKNISPRPRWQYILLHVWLWTSGIVTLVLGSFACAFMILEFSLPERAYLQWVESQDGWLLALPYLWGIGMIFALTIGYFVFSKTGRSYRYQAGAIAGILILGSVVWWATLFITRTAHWSDQQIQRFEPRYWAMRRGFHGQIPRPEDGVLPLRVLEMEEDAIRGKTPDWHSWSVTLQCGDEICEQHKSRIRPWKPSIFEWKVRSEWVFEASRVLPGPWFRPKNLRPIPKDIRGNTSAKKGE